MYVKDLRAEISENARELRVRFASTLKGPVRVLPYWTPIVGDRTILSRTRRGAAIVAIAIASNVVPAFAKATRTQTVPVLLTVEHACKLVTKPLDFGTPDPKAKSATASTTITLTCTPGTVYSVGIDNGLNWDAKGGTRRMYGGSSNGQVWYADYQLYHDALHLLPWGTGATAAVGVLGLPGKTFTVYGETQIKNLRPAPYRDTVIVQLDF